MNLLEISLVRLLDYEQAPHYATCLAVHPSILRKRGESILSVEQSVREWREGGKEASGCERQQALSQADGTASLSLPFLSDPSTHYSPLSSRRSSHYHS